MFREICLAEAQIVLFLTVVQQASLRKNPNPRHERSSEIPGGSRGSFIVKILAAKYEAKLEFPWWMGSAKQKPFHGRSMDIFWNYPQDCMMLSILCN